MLNLAQLGNGKHNEKNIYSLKGLRSLTALLAIPPRSVIEGELGVYRDFQEFMMLIFFL